MPNWKKLIVSGSDANLSSLKIDGALTASSAYLESASIGHLQTIYETASVIYSSGSTKFGDTLDDTHEITGSLLVTGSITGDLTGTASFATSASFAVTASHVIGGATNSGSFSGSFEGDGSGLTGISVTQAATITDSFIAETSITTSHNFVTENVLVTAYNNNGEQIIPQTVRTLDENNVGVDFSTSTTGRIVVAKGGHIVSGSVLTASLAMELSNLATASIADFATTASHTIGTASIANLATTSSIADLASTLSNTATASFADSSTTASFAVTASYALNAAAGGGGIGYTNPQTLSADLTVEDNVYTSLYGPLEVASGITIEVQTGSFLKIEDF